MLDLGKLQQKLYKVKLLDGTILQIPKPSQLLLKKMIDLEKTENKATDLLYEIKSYFGSHIPSIAFTLSLSR